MNKMEKEKDEVLQDIAGGIYMEFCQELRDTEHCDGSFEGVFTYEDAKYWYRVSYYVWYDMQKRMLTWQFDFESPLEELEDYVEQWLTDVANDNIGLAVDNDNDFR